MPTQLTSSVRFCIVSRNELVVLDSLENSKQYKKRTKTFPCVRGLIENTHRGFVLFLVGVGYDPTQRKLGSTTKREGLHFGAPGFRFIKFSSLFQTVSYTKVSCLNKDGLVINLDVQFQYRVDANDLRDVILEFKNADNYEDIVRYITNYLRNLVRLHP